MVFDGEWMLYTPWGKEILNRSPKYGGVLIHRDHVVRLSGCAPGTPVKVHHETTGSWKKPTVIIEVHDEDWEDWDISGGPVIFVKAADDNGEVHSVPGWNVEILRRNPPRSARSS